MSSQRARASSRRMRARRGGTTAFRRARHWRKLAVRVWRRLRAAPPALSIPLLAAAALAVFAAANFAYHAMRKPSELLFPMSEALDKRPAETWRDYGPLFREYSTAAIPAALLAALAQVEGAGNPLARTYWRWRLTWHPFAIYEPASSAVGMYQMTDAAFAEAQRYCIRAHEVVAEGCGPDALYTRLLPRHAVELAAVFLDRNVASILDDRRGARANPRQVEALAAIVHLCGAGPARAFARRGFRLARGERCGDHDAAAYLARIETMAQQFRRFAEER